MAFTDGALIPRIIQFPQVVQDAVKQFGNVFANERQRRHFAESLAGLMSPNGHEFWESIASLRRLPINRALTGS